MKTKEIWTIGHSTHTFEAFISLLKSFEIELLVDVRRFPGSRRYPHFNKDNLDKSILEAGIKYIHMEDLGGRRTVQPNSKNDAWRLKSFQAYADYMETDDFKIAIKKLKSLAETNKTAIMCAEAVWWSCHRSLISDCLKYDEWTVMHITGKSKSTEHPYTKPAKIENGKLLYRKY